MSRITTIAVVVDNEEKIKNIALTTENNTSENMSIIYDANGKISSIGAVDITWSEENG